MTSLFSFKNCFAFSRPCPSLSSLYEYHAPLFWTISKSEPMSNTSPSLEIPSPYMISTTACLNGGATLFLTTFNLVRFPTMSFLVSMILHDEPLNGQKNKTLRHGHLVLFQDFRTSHLLSHELDRKSTRLNSSHVSIS